MKHGIKKLVVLFRNSFIAGIAVLLPLWVTAIVVKFLVVWVNRSLVNPIAALFKVTFNWVGIEPVFWAIKFIVFFAVLIGIAFIGMVARTIVVRRLISFGEGILLRIPLVRNVYRAVQQFRDTFIVNKQSIFQRVVLIEYPREGIFSIGFVTSEVKTEVHSLTKEDLITVFIPTVPNPTTGFFMLLPRKHTKPLSMTVEDGIKLVISGGALTPNMVEKVHESADPNL